MTMEATDIDHSEDPKSTNNNNINNSPPKELDEKIDESDERTPPPGASSSISDTHKVNDADVTEENKSTATEDNNDEEELDLGDTSKLDGKGRNELFEKGLVYDKKGKKKMALQCYFGCMKGLHGKTNFVLLPECLHNIAEIFESQGNFEQAVQFAQAEKLFYESALIETQEIQKKIEEVSRSEDSSPATDLNELNIEAMRAEEYEHLARLCLDQNQAQLALEYAGKCAKIRQRVYGENHSKTKETLDFFASLYAEVGKEQYSDSFTLLNNLTQEDYQAPQVINSASPSGEPTSILRQRKTGQREEQGDQPDGRREKKQVRFDESINETSHIEMRRDREELASLTVTLMLLVICFLILFALGLWLFCSIDRGQTCHIIASRAKSWFMKLRYYFHTHNTPPKAAFST